MKHTYYQSSVLVDRLCNAFNSKDEAVVFLVGSAVSLPDHEGGHGVPGVSDIVELVRREFDGTDAVNDFDRLVNVETAHSYQKAFEFLNGRRGQDVANKIIRATVWRALDLTNSSSLISNISALPSDLDTDVFKALENDSTVWILPRAVDLLGALLVNYSDTFGDAVLTTNFDPLIEVSILKHGGQRYRTVLPNDGNLEQTVSEGTHVIHLHGYWWGYDTLNTLEQLVRPRPQLKRSLYRVIESSTLVVIGYGGWDDIITHTLLDIVSDEMSTPEILWAFHDSEPSSIESTSEALLELLKPGIQRGRVMLYRGVECVSLFSEISEQLKSTYPPAPKSPVAPEITTVVKETPSGTERQKHTPIVIDFVSQHQASAGPDSPLLIEPWIGRDQELDILTATNTQVWFITGIGGQGKSALAGRFLKVHCIDSTGQYDFWDWRDCKEQSDRLNTQILRLIERLSNGKIDTGKIETTNIRAVVDVLFRVLQDRKALLVFDNIDQYVDLETFGLVKGLDYLVGEAQARSHQSVFLFTCRLDVQLDESRSLRLPLQGLSEDETGELLAIRGIPKAHRHLAKMLHQITKGHPLWINLVVMQAVRNNGNLEEAIHLISRGGGQLPDTTRTIWGTLNDQQRAVLRTMAELDRPETESQLQHLLPGVRFNRVYKALKTLRSYHLVEVRTQADGEPLLGLHPIIREFVRRNFPKRDREKYVDVILDYLDNRIKQFRALLPQEPSYQILENWTRKAELQIAFGHFEEAMTAIDEISDALINRGYSEEFVRLTLRLFGECDWAVACSSYKRFDAVFNQCIMHMAQMGHESIEELLTLYGEAIPGKSAQFILLSDLRCYVEWYAGNFEAAVHWGEKGNELKESTSVDTEFSSKHNLALARRDSGQVAEALEMFLEGESLAEVLNSRKNTEEKGSEFYGNVGRCLYYLHRFDEALKCYVKSAKLLQTSRTNRDYLNRGYIRLWIGQLLLQRGEQELAAVSFRAAICIWDEVSPPRSSAVKDELNTLIDDDKKLSRYLEEADWRVEKHFSNWLDNQ